VVAIKSVRPAAAAVRSASTREAAPATPPHPPSERRTTGAGSGVILRSDGLILTNEHVIHDAEEIIVHLHDGRDFPGHVVQIDSRGDLAIVRIGATGLQAAILGDVFTIRQGHLVFAMGNPFGVASEVGNASMSWGIVSALGRPLPLLGAAEDRYYGNLIETTAPINPGNSGGPLFDIYGRVVGINTAISTRSGRSEGVGFAVPMSARTRNIIETLMRGDEVQYGLLGVFAKTPDDQQRVALGGPRGRGALVDHVDPDSPADRAQIRSGDLIVRFDGQDVIDADHLVRMAGGTPPGQPVEVVLFRDRKQMALQAVLIRRDRVGLEDTAPFRWRGMTVVARGLQTQRPARPTHTADDETTDLVITEVRPWSPSEKAGLKPGMIIRSAGREPIGTLRRLRQVARSVGAQPVRIETHDGHAYELQPGL